MNLTPMNIKSDDALVSSDYDSRPCLYLNDDQVEALGIKGMPAPGTVFTLQARAVVRHVTASAEEPDEVDKEGNAPDVSLSLCLTDIGLQPDSGKSAAEMASSLYGSTETQQRAQR